MTCVVFLGPSLATAEARAILDADYRPPASANDVLDAVCDAPRAIVVIDGLFEQVLSVRHKEILYALSRGIRVYGAASMGALRAAELDVFGMRGVGRVYEAYASGEYEDDDEVAVAHGETDYGFRPVSEAMVNLRWGLELAEAQHVISTTTRTRLTAVGKTLFYRERSWAALLALGADEGVPAHELQALRAFVKHTQPNRKREDAVMVLEEVREDLRRQDLAPLPEFEFRLTRPLTHWLDAVRSRRLSRAPTGGVAGAEAPRRVTNEG